MTGPIRNEWIEFRPSNIHGMGAYAHRTIPEGTLVIQYVGERIDKPESARRCEANNPFIFELDEGHDIDGNVDWNPARWINHACEPNAETQVLDDAIWVVALRDIQPGEEVTFNYRYSLEDYRDYPCCCGAPDCVKYIVAPEHFEHVRFQNQLAEVELERDEMGLPRA
jgi:hypothetical protein